MTKNIYLRKKYLDGPAVDVMGTAVLALTWGCIMIAWAWSGLGGGFTPAKTLSHISEPAANFLSETRKDTT